MVQDGAVELQAILDEMLEPLVVISWHAGWVDVCRDAVQPVRRKLEELNNEVPLTFVRKQAR